MPTKKLNKIKRNLEMDEKNERNLICVSGIASRFVD